MAQAQTNATLHVVERRTCVFTGSFTSMTWQFDALPDHAVLTVNGVRMAEVDIEGNVIGDWTVLPDAGFQLSWRTDGPAAADIEGPEEDGYAYDAPQNRLYAFFSATDKRMTFEIDYSVENGVTVYDDVSEIIWRYVLSNWEVDSQNVSLQIALPVPPDTEVVPGGNVEAWGHGPANGLVDIGTDGVVLYRVPRVPAGQFCEAHVLFPAKWMTNVSNETSALHQGTLRLSNAVEEERAWFDEEAMRASLECSLDRWFVIISAAAILLTLLLYLLFGRERRPSFKDTYSLDIPDDVSDPASVGRLWRWNHEDWRDFVVTVLDLDRIGKIRLCQGYYEDDKGSGVHEYYLENIRWKKESAEKTSGSAPTEEPETKSGVEAENPRTAEDSSGGATPAAASDSAAASKRTASCSSSAADTDDTQIPGAAESPSGNGASPEDDASPGNDASADSRPELTDVQRATLRFLFKTVADKQDRLWFSTLASYVANRPEGFKDAMIRWQATLSNATDKAGFFDRMSYRVSYFTLVLSVLFALGAIASGIYFGKWFPVVLFLATAAVLLLIANYMPRRSRHGNDTVARFKALRNWLRDGASKEFSRDEMSAQSRGRLENGLHCLENPASEEADGLWRRFFLYGFLFGVSKETLLLREATLERAGGHKDFLDRFKAPRAEVFSNLRALYSTQPIGKADADATDDAKETADVGEDSCGPLPWMAWYVGTDELPPAVVALARALGVDADKGGSRRKGRRR